MSQVANPRGPASRLGHVPVLPCRLATRDPGEQVRTNHGHDACNTSTANHSMRSPSR
jgi:hypothetical protein